MSFTLFDRVGKEPLRLPQLRDPCICSPADTYCAVCRAWDSTWNLPKARGSRTQVCFKDGKPITTKLRVKDVRKVHALKSQGWAWKVIAEKLRMKVCQVRAASRIRLVQEDSSMRFDCDKDEIQVALMQLSAEKGLTDAEVAKELGVSAVSVGIWRRRLGIPTNGKFFRHFDLNYGEGAVDEFRKMLGQLKTYAEIGRHFGFSRQRAFQIAVEHFFYKEDAADEDRAE